MDGLVWNNEPKISEVAYGIQKLELGCVIEDEKVSTDTICETIQKWDNVQTCEVSNFQKL